MLISAADARRIADLPIRKTQGYIDVITEVNSLIVDKMNHKKYMLEYELTKINNIDGALELLIEDLEREGFTVKKTTRKFEPIGVELSYLIISW